MDEETVGATARRARALLVQARPGELAADELAVMWCDNPWRVRRLLARCARVRSGLPSVWEAHGRGEVDAEQLQVIDRAARRATRDATRAQIDARAVDAARTRNPAQLGAWLLRLVVECSSRWWRRLDRAHRRRGRRV